jgi:uncharacterized protein (DUF433 family)
MKYKSIITIDKSKRGGKPCIRNMRIAVADVLGWLAAGMSINEIIDDYPELVEEDILACLAYAADRERRILTAA